jgi:hypothetical protein
VNKTGQTKKELTETSVFVNIALRTTIPLGHQEIEVSHWIIQYSAVGA